ncbi:MAG: 3-deoxy-manno-octulosonate cytidylyltransferase [Synergistaceae bacterium]|nr:3-deoxy-manno-octulosonate cytidylyltransferase [Synergistaceae bacterium]
MKILCVIPARYASTRMPGKPLADICGKPMLWWVYHRVKDIDVFAEVICAVDDERISRVCEDFGMKYILTSPNHPEHISRIQEVSGKIPADYYMCINGDEPMISPECILPVVPDRISSEPYFGGAMRLLTSPAEVIDPANIKLAVTSSGKCLYMSRNPVPYPKGTLSVKYRKYVGVECFNSSALNFFVRTPKGILETYEDIDHLRFLENGIPLYFTAVESESISVDTPKDLDFVREKIRNSYDWGGGTNYLSYAALFRAVEEGAAA